jgi:hypothetical protein
MRVGGGRTEVGTESLRLYKPNRGIVLEIIQHPNNLLRQIMPDYKTVNGVLFMFSSAFLLNLTIIPLDPESRFPSFPQLLSFVHHLLYCILLSHIHHQHQCLHLACKMGPQSGIIIGIVTHPPTQPPTHPSHRRSLNQTLSQICLS